MSEKPRPSFRSIAAPLDVDDAVLERINVQLGVPTLTKPAGNVSGGAPRRATGYPEVPEAESAPVRAPLEKLTIEIPAYLTDALKRSALETRTTVRHVVMSALQGAGFEVAKADLVADGRRRRGKSQ